MSPDDERARLDGFYAFYAAHPPAAWEEAVTEAERRVPGWLLDQQHAAVADTSALEFAVLAAISHAPGGAPRRER